MTSYRKWCTKCGGPVFTDHPLMKDMPKEFGGSGIELPG
jgi:hypothetical protein